MTKPAQPLLSRRKAVAALTVGGLATGAIAASQLSFTSTKFATKALSFWDRPTVDLATAGSSDWTAKVGSTFTLASERGNLDVKLAKVTTFPSVGTKPAGVRNPAFALAFDSLGGALPEGDRIYTLTHSGGALQVYFSDTDKVILAVFS
jgi:hypothetical protein